jgi:hypothetical protein
MEIAVIYLQFYTKLFELRPVLFPGLNSDYWKN